MRLNQKRDRELWTAYVEGREPSPESKYGNVNTVKQGGYASKHEAEVAANLQALASRGLITDYKEQERIVLVPGNGKVRPIVWIADFVYIDQDKNKHYLDAKGYRTPVYRLKKRLFQLLHNLDIEEV